MEKIIHYCWFGRGPKPKSVKIAIETWKDKMSDYRIIEWNEESFDINSVSYVLEAYQHKKYAFVSDYVRLYALYKYGGIYFDTDVEVLNDISVLGDINAYDLVVGFEAGNFIATSTLISKKGNEFIRDFLNYYDEISFIKSDGQLNLTSNVTVITKRLEDIGLVRNNCKQAIDFSSHEQILVLPMEYLSPYDYLNKRLFCTNMSFCIHNYDSTWGSITTKLKMRLKSIITKTMFRIRT